MKTKEKIIINPENAIKEFERLIKIIQKNPRVAELEYKDVDITTSSVLATNLNIKQTLSKKGLKYEREHGRKPLEVLLWKLFQLGYQQGYNYRTNETQFLMDIYEKTIRNYNADKILETLEDTSNDDDSDPKDNGKFK